MNAITIDEKMLSGLLADDVEIRHVEPAILSVLTSNETGNTYDKQFGKFYDLVACNPVYNRIIWGYSTLKFSSLVDSTIHSSPKGFVLDVGCWSLAFTAKTYSRYYQRPVIFVDQSIKLLRMTKRRLIKLNGNVPKNMIFLHADALNLPFASRSFNTIIALNLLHVLSDIDTLLQGIKKVLADGGSILFTTLIRGDRLADKYLKVWENAGEVISRSKEDFETVFAGLDMPFSSEVSGNMAFIQTAL